jgi:hypothetical protein
VRWTFEREARWMLLVSLIPILGVTIALAWPALMRLLE